MCHNNSKPKSFNAVAFTLIKPSVHLGCRIIPAHATKTPCENLKPCFQAPNDNDNPNCDHNRL